MITVAEFKQNVALLKGYDFEPVTADRRKIVSVGFGPRGLDFETAERVVTRAEREKITAHVIMREFAFGHLPPSLACISAIFHRVAVDIILDTPECPQREIALQRLLEAKDAAVRAARWPDTGTQP